MRISIAWVVVALATTPAYAHIKLDSPAPRTNDLKAGPCGATGSTRGASVATFAPGQTITVEWDETVDHPGHYRIAFDPDGGDNFPDPVQPDDAFATTLVDQITDKVGGHYTQDVTLPDLECDNCTLQLVQVMTTAVPYNSFYFQCSDIVLSASAGGGDDDGTSSAPTEGGCNAGGTNRGGGVALGLALLLGLRRRRSA